MGNSKSYTECTLLYYPLNIFLCVRAQLFSIFYPNHHSRLLPGVTGIIYTVFVFFKITSVSMRSKVGHHATWSYSSSCVFKDVQCIVLPKTKIYTARY